VSDIRIGTSGWSYPSGQGTWNGVFYPVRPGRRQKGAPRFDELAFYAAHFDTVEVNSSFYRPPTPDTVRTWIARTPPGFEFSVKLYQKFTHPEMFARSTGADPSRLGQQDVDAFRAVLDPLADAGKLGAVLAQFPPSFKYEPEAAGYLEWLLRSFAAFPVAVELRHRSWSDAAGEVVALLDAHRAAWAHIDEPKFRSSVRQALSGGSGSFYYLRLHGRNAAEWWNHDTTEDRYNYLYAAHELEPFAETARRVSREEKKAYLYANNHFSAKSVASAAILKHQLGQPLPGEYPAEFIERYPDLRGIVRILPDQPVLIPGQTPA
jgi:uncharacterized protein YecE (DUF72 family)